MTTFVMIDPEQRDGRWDNCFQRNVCKLKKHWKRSPRMFIAKVIAGAILGAIAIATGLIIGVSLCSNSPHTVECTGEWIGVRNKCLYISKETGNWTASESFCISQGSKLAHIDNHEEMEFFKKLIGTSMHWLGLIRKEGEPWKWTNGTTFNNRFEINGNGFFAFLNADGVSSSRGHIALKWICSKPRFK